MCLICDFENRSDGVVKRFEVLAWVLSSIPQEGRNDAHPPAREPKNDICPRKYNRLLIMNQIFEILMVSKHL